MSKSSIVLGDGKRNAAPPAVPFDRRRAEREDLSASLLQERRREVGERVGRVATRAVESKEPPTRESTQRHASAGARDVELGDQFHQCGRWNPTARVAP